MKLATKQLAVALAIGYIFVLWIGIADAQSQKKGASKEDSGSSQTETFSPGIAIGTKVPEIKLNDQTGKKVSLQELYQKQPVALVLYRSADW